MPSVTVLRSVFDRTAWKLAFADQLMRLRPDLNPDAADEVSDSEFALARGAEPAVAARHWLARQGGDEATRAAVGG